MNAAAAAQQSGDAEQVAAANKRLLAVALYRLAEVRSAQGAFDSAAELYRQSVEMEDTPESGMALALAYLRVNRIDDALRASVHLTEIAPANAMAWNLRGKLSVMSKDYKQAAMSLEKSLQIQPDGEVSFTLATTYLQLKEPAKAEAIFTEMQRVSGNSPDVHIIAGRSYEGAGMTDAAEKEYRKAIAIDPKGSGGHYFLGLLYLVKNGWEVTPQARQEFLEEVAVNPNGFFGNYFMGYITSGEKKFDESDGYLKIAAAAKPDWPEPYLYLGLNAYGRRDDRRAEQWLRKAIETTGKDEARNNYQIRRAYFALGRILVQNGKKEEATKYLLRSREIETNLVVKGRQQQALDIGSTSEKPVASGSEPAAAVANAPAAVDPTAPVSADLLNASKLTEQEKQDAAAVEKQLRSILGTSYNDLGTAEARQHRYDQALGYFQQAKKWSPDVPNLLRNIGLAAFLSKNYTESVEALKTVVEQEPQDQRSQSMLAMSLFALKDYAAAVPVFDRVPDAATNDPRMAYGWALSLAKTNNLKRASGVLEKLVAQTIPPQMLVMAGQLYADIGEKNKANDCFRRAKDQDPSIQLPR